MSQKPKKDFYRTYQTSDSLSFLDASLVKRLEPLLAQRDRPGCVDLPSFVSMIYDLASRNSDLRKGEELSYVECLCVLFQAVADSQVLLPGIDAPEALSFNELDWSWVTDFFIREKISSVKIKDPNEEEEAGAAGAQGGSGGEGQRDAPRFTVSKIADYSTHPGDVCALMAWHRWGLILSADREYPAVKVYDPYQQPHGPPIYCGDLPFFPYNMSGGSLIRRSDVTLHDFIQNMCTPPTAMDVKKGSKLKEERIMVPPRQVVYPPKGAFPIMVAVDEKNDTLGVIFSSRHLCFWQCGDGGLRLTAIYPVHTAFTGLWYVEKSLGEWIGAFADFNLGVYNREQLRLKYGSPMSFSLVPQRSNADVKLVAPLAILRGHMDQVVMIIPIQEDYMASASYDCNVLIWERKTGAQMKRISSGVGLRGIAYNWTMDLLMTVGFAPEASLYQLGKIDDGSATSSIKRAGVLRGHISGLTCCAFMGPHMAITCDDVGYIRLWDLKNGQNSCFQMIQSDTVAQSIALVHRLEEGYVKMGHFSRQARERAEFTLQELLTQQEDSDFVIGGERLLKIRKMGQHPQAGNIPQIIFADICYLNHSLVVVTEQYVYAFHAESGVQLRAVSAQQIFADAEDKVAEKERDNYEIAREHAEESAARGSRFAFPGSVPGSPTTSGGGSPGGGASVVGSNPGGRSTTSPNAGGSKSGGKGGLLGEEEEGASQKTVSREADSRLQTSVERAFTTEIMGKRVYRKQELKKLALERKYGVGFDKKNKFSKTSSAGFFGGLFAPEVSSPSPRRRRRSGSHMNSDDSDTQGGGRGGKKGGRGERGAGGLGGNTMNSTSTMSDQKSQMSKTHSGSFFRGRAGKKSPHSYSSESEADDLDLDEINEHLLEDNHQIRKDNRGMETISSACFDATQARLILGSDRGKIIIVDNKRFQPVCPRLRNTHMAGKSVTHLVYIPQTATNIGHYRYYNYGLQKGAHIAEIQHMMQEPKNQQFLPSVEHFLRPPLNLPEGLIASGGSDGTILLVSDNPARGYPLQFRLTYSQDACRLKNLFFDFDSGYLVSVTDSYIKWWEPHLDNGEPARTIPLTQKNLHALGVAKGEPNAADPAGSVSFATTGGIASSSALGGDGPGGVVVGTGGAASSTGSMVLGGPSGGGGLLGAQPGGGGLVGVQNGALLASSLVASSSSAPGGGTPQQALPRYLPLRSDQLIGSAALRWRRYNNNLAFSVDATTGEIFCINMERGEVETRFHHRKTIIHKDEIHDVQFKTTAMCLVEWDVNKLEWADPAKKSGPVAFSQRPPTQTPPSTAERDATRGKRPSLAELESFPLQSPILDRLANFRISRIFRES
ncbi:unnamed protein product [Amoebophrya sp. A25]|nr:unnamed protein product [Amoebophrya sp. A25]|eukprot:GSA25T00006383001.1